MTFAEAVKAANHPAVQQACLPGKQALEGEHREKLHCANPRSLTGSINLDDALKGDEQQAQANRWDYGIGYRSGSQEYAIWLEVHPATTSEVGNFLAKLAWLKAFLQQHASELNRMTTPCCEAVKPFVWLSTKSGTHINENSPQMRQLKMAGIDMPKPVLKLP